MSFTAGTSGFVVFPLSLLDPPKLVSVSASPSGDIVEGSSVNLTCSSDANPAANYTRYKGDGDSPQASGQTSAITDIRAELGIITAKPRTEGDVVTTPIRLLGKGTQQ
ncbi:uncharacterized protein LOC120800893 [Xiphias gladius]|uniref:uncharacterized protein LOC120800893 n=1 Tax=Xiphias gladius TaxID=8245 RepID=UPI001A97E9CC|nr:uncharacterized protein LOC120800893 [Xiphias gladius]